MPKRAIIDIGTNSVILLIAERAEGTLHVHLDTAAITRLGEHFYVPGRAPTLSEEAMDRTLATIERFVARARAEGVADIRAYGTNVLRLAENRATFIVRARERCGLDVGILSGEAEAHLSYLAVRRDATFGLPSSQRSAVLDVGGGSTEWVIGQENVEQMASIPLGAVRLTERFFQHDPPTLGEIEHAREEIRSQLGSAETPHTVGHLVGIGGTLVTLAAVRRGTHVKDPLLHGLRLSLSDVRDLRTRFRRLRIEELRRLPGLDPARADIILGGTLIVESAMEWWEVSELGISTWGWRYGALLQPEAIRLLFSSTALAGTRSA